MMMRLGVVLNIVWAGACIAIGGCPPEPMGNVARDIFLALGIACGLLSIVLAIDDAAMRVRR
jgi:hypothetical protein